MLRVGAVEKREPMKGSGIDRYATALGRPPRKVLRGKPRAADAVVLVKRPRVMVRVKKEERRMKWA